MIKFYHGSVEDIKLETYRMTIKEVLRFELRYNYDLRKNLTKQQIHTEIGKVRRGFYEEVINFLVKRGFTKEHFDNAINMDRVRAVVTQKITAPVKYVTIDIRIKGDES